MNDVHEPGCVGAFIGGTLLLVVTFIAVVSFFDFMVWVFTGK